MFVDTPEALAAAIGQDSLSSPSIFTRRRFLCRLVLRSLFFEKAEIRF